MLTYYIWSPSPGFILSPLDLSYNPVISDALAYSDHFTVPPPQHVVNLQASINAPDEERPSFMRW